MSFGEKFKEFMHIDDADLEITDEEIAAAAEKMKEEEPKEKKRSFFSMKAAPQEEEKPSSYKALSYEPYGKAEPKVPVQTQPAFTATTGLKVLLIEPKSFAECPKLVDNLKGRRPVIINLENVETDVAKKIFDFMSGATYALSGNVQKISNNIYIFAPQSVDVALNGERSFEVNKAPLWKED